MERFSWVLRLPLVTFGLFILPLAVAGLYLASPSATDSRCSTSSSEPTRSIVFFVFGATACPRSQSFVFAAHRSSEAR